MMKIINTDVTSWTLSSARRALRAGMLSAEEYLAELLSHHKRVGDFGAYITTTHEQALFAARRADRRLTPPSVLAGLPLVVKDNIDVAGVPTTAGTPRLAQHIPAINSAIWQRLDAAGAALLGKTSMHELAYGTTGQCAANGVTAANPKKPGYLAGGSSSGTAAAISAGLAPAGLGTDTGGSCRIPAAICGIVGFRPSPGRYPHAGLLRVSPTRDTIGLLARDVEDLMLLDALITGSHLSFTAASSRPKRLAVPAPAWQNLSPDVACVAWSALNALERAGYVLIHTEDDSLIAGSEADMLDIATTVPLAETLGSLAAYLQETRANISAAEVVRHIALTDIRQLLSPLINTPFPTENYRAALAKQTRLRQRAAIARRHLNVDAVVTPTTVLPAPSSDVGDTVNLNGIKTPTMQAYIRNTAPAAILATPSISIPAGMTAAGLPVGLLLDGHPQEDRRLLQLALACAHRLTDTAPGGAYAAI